MSLPTFNRPTISLAMIIKNERKNLQRLLESVKDCFDEIHITDTGSDDGSIEFLKSEGAKISGCPVFIHHFKWVNSFCEARNYSFSKVKTDFVYWQDGDDILHDREGFIKWRNYAMEFADMWLASYHYAVDKDLKPIVSFVRERVFRTSLNPLWQYDLHEGIVPQNGWRQDYAIAWSIKHLRDIDDINADKSRNIKILENIKEKKGLDPRLKFYYGKELYEQGRPHDSITAFEDALKEDLQTHDKILSYQYASYAATQCADLIKDDMKDHKEFFYKKALEFCQKGILLDPNRAEFHTTAGDIYLKKGDMIKSIPYYSAAKRCINPRDSGSPYEGAIYSFVDCYGLNPTMQLAKIYFNLGNMEACRNEAQESLYKFKSDEAKMMIEELDRIKSITTLDNNQIDNEDIVFTCPPQSAYEFDEESYKTKGMGGSETALIEMAKWIKIKTGRSVKVFNMRENDLIADSGVEYYSSKKLNQYFSNNRPKLHIAWRHNIELTRAKTYLWCHDLVTPGVEVKNNFNKIMCLTDFHKNYVQARQNVKDDKILITRNGIDPEKFKFERKEKNHNKLVWMSSPDRGLDSAIIVCDEVKKYFPNIELHVYYGLDNLYKFGMNDLADKLKGMMDQRPWVKYHGFTEQSKMYQEISDAVVWVHPCNFIETFCITAIEQLELKIFPVTRYLGGLRDTLKDAALKGHAVMLNHACDNHENVIKYAEQVKSALNDKKWEKIEFDISKHSWSSIADEWIKEMGL